MKKETVVTLRVTPELKAVIQKLAEDDDRTIAWMARKLIIEALESRDASKKLKRRKNKKAVMEEDYQ
ncbi:MAG: ribbon-helix-helix protein, CopG family [Nitrospirae bacterium]|nr:ribbon-helix-helix protein, CopG family [Nitrospirota bacterium]